MRQQKFKTWINDSRTICCGNYKIELIFYNPEVAMIEELDYWHKIIDINYWHKNVSFGLAALLKPVKDLSFYHFGP